ncbi:ubiquitin ligase (Hul4) [Fusarium subglutinans]|uniref:Ubiquitin ligase (Hul4) n=1 Tax=Gibberella subglutinans TaxID=42677 RepID=A0A8H5V2R7_GIBSU|nr:ubiquitin ligase (Hul4) [Fusarium subglutinans]KAF5607218.1 ubiquitin ligase (Hul4) [Fusarium subglutinans]
MIISSSPLFKEYAQKTFDSGNRNRRAPFSPLGIADIVVQHLLDLAKLEITRFKISNATEDSFNIVIEGRMFGTGTISSTIISTEASLSFNGTAFGRIKLPQTKTSFWGTDFVVQEQRVEITDYPNYCAFIRGIIVDDETSLQLENNNCTVRALGTSSVCNLRLDMPLKAIGGPRMAVKKLSRLGSDVTIVFSLTYLGPFELDHGCCIFELRNGHSETSAELKGELNIAAGQTELTLHGTTRDGAVASNRVRLVGVGVEAKEKSWLNETIREIDVPVDLEPKCAEILWC